MPSGVADSSWGHTNTKNREKDVPVAVKLREVDSFDVFTQARSKAAIENNREARGYKAYSTHSPHPQPVELHTQPDTRQPQLFSHMGLVTLVTQHRRADELGLNPFQLVFQLT